MDKGGRDRRKDEHEEAADAAAAVVSAASSEGTGKAPELCQQGNCSGEGGSDGTGQDVAILHMPQLMRQYTLELLIIEQIENTLGYGNGGMLWGFVR